MNYIEISKIISKMINNTRVVSTNLEVARLKDGLTIDKKGK